MSGREFLETGESVWFVNCGHHFSDHILAPSDSPSLFYNAREYLGCKGREGGRKDCECKKFTPYQVEKSQTEKQDKENTEESTPK
jgi:hypothetical protein